MTNTFVRRVQFHSLLRLYFTSTSDSLPILRRLLMQHPTVLMQLHVGSLPKAPVSRYWRSIPQAVYVAQKIGLVCRRVARRWPHLCQSLCYKLEARTTRDTTEKFPNRDHFLRIIACSLGVRFSKVEYEYPLLVSISYRLWKRSQDTFTKYPYIGTGALASSFPSWLTTVR